MADQTRTKTRIYELTETTTLSSDMNLAVDTEEGGTKRVQLSTLIDGDLNTAGKAADSKAVGDALAGKVDKEAGKGLSEANFTSTEKTKLAGIQEGAAAVDSTLSVTGKAADAKKTGDEITHVKQDNSELRDTFSDVIDYIDVTYTQNYIYRTTTDPVVLTPESLSGFSCALVECKEGDLFTITGRGGNAAHYYVFTDANGNKLLDGDTPSQWAENVDIIAPKNSKYLALNNYNTYGTPKCIKNRMFYSTSGFDASDFEIGGISSSDGTETTASRFRSADYIDFSNVIAIRAEASNRVCLYAYNADNTFKGVYTGSGSTITPSGNPYWLKSIDFGNIRWNSANSGLKYRLVFENTTVAGGVRFYTVGSVKDMFDMFEAEKDSIEENITDIQNEIDNIGGQLFTSDNYYMSDDSVALAGSSSALFALYDSLVTAYPAIVTKNTLTSGTLTNYEYVFSTGNYNVSGQRDRDAEIVKPTIMVTTGIHGDEKSSVMSTYAMCKAMCEGAFPAASILEKCTLRVIPCVCTWGFNNNKRYNENGVNINRNFDANWVQQGEPYDTGYSGASAASENETKIVQAWIDSNISNALMLVDFHNSAYANEVSWLSFLNTLADTESMKKGYRMHIDDAIGYWRAKRGMTNPTLIYGYTGSSNVSGGCDMYGVKMGGFAGTLETSWNQNNFGLHSNKTIGVGCEAMSCVLLGAIDRLVDN